MNFQNAIHAVMSLSLAISIACLSGGCRICNDCGDADYPAYGGAWQRTIRETGRVGSVFDPAGGRASSLTSRDEPTEIDEIERGKDRSSISDDAEAEQADQADRDGREDDDLEPADDDEMPSLEDVEDDRSRGLRDLELDDIEVKVLTPQPSEIY